MEHIRAATVQDVSRVAEILVFNNRINFFPIFKDEGFSFGKMQVLTVANEYLSDEELLRQTYVYDDGLIRGMITAGDGEVKKLYVDPFFQKRGIGEKLLNYAIREHQVNFLWALEKNPGAIRFYQRHGFRLTDEKVFEEDTTEYLVKMVR